MNAIHAASIASAHGMKSIEVYTCDILNFDEKIDILTTSAFRRDYIPTPRSLFGALSRAGVSVEQLARSPQIDLREMCNVWLSEEIGAQNVPIGRIGCIEMVYRYSDSYMRMLDEHSLLNSLSAYFHMLDIAAVYGIPMETVALPLLGAGNQHVSGSLVITPIINECIAFLKRNQAVKRICFIERSEQKSGFIRDVLQSSYNVMVSVSEEDPLLTKAAPGAKAFISYSSPDKNIADNLCAKLERRGIRAWYAPRDVRGPYASSIVEAINEATHFIVILSRNSMQSEHVLNEIDLAFKKLPRNIKFKPLRIDEAMFTPSFEYYLSRQHWMDAHNPPLEARLEEFVDKILNDL